MITKDERKKTMNINSLSIKNYITQMADEVLRIWKRAPVPTRYRHHVIEMARLMWAKGVNICESGKSMGATHRICNWHHRCSDDTSDGIDG